MENIKPIKVLQINAGSGQFGGVSSFLRNVYKQIDTKHVQFNFLSPNITTYESVRDELEERGAKIFELHCGMSKFKQLILILKLKKFLAQYRYDIVHINSGGVGFNTISAWTVKHFCDSKIIVHSHNTNTKVSFVKGMYNSICRLFLNQYADLKLACSNAAGKYMFGEDADFLVINNGIELEKFKYNKDIRKRIREDFSIDDNTVLIGFVGRLVKQKNPMFAIEIFNEIQRKKTESLCWIIGEGELRYQVQESVTDLNIEKKVSFLGERHDVERLMQSMDVLLLPSLYEGLGIVAIEAQTAGLQVFASDTIPQETKISSNIEYISLKDDSKEWADRIIKKLNNCTERTAIMDPAYNIKTVAQDLTFYYEKLYWEK